MRKKKEFEIEITEKNFEEKVIKQSKKIPVVADFYAEWCMPCLMLGPTLEKLVKEYKGKFILAKINVDDSREIAKKYKIMSIPNVKLFKNGKVVGEFVGVMSEGAIRRFLEKYAGEERL